jgi:hypothetical protein
VEQDAVWPVFCAGILQSHGSNHFETKVSLQRAV